MKVNSEAKASHILVLGAGELGMSVLRHLARRSASISGMTITVMLRPTTIDTQDPIKRMEIDELHSLGIRLLPGDLAAGSDDVLAEIFANFDTVISCTGFAAGRGTQRKLAHAAIAAGVRRYFPWQFGVDYDVIGRGSAQDLFDEQLDVRDMLRSQNKTEWVIISTGMFTSFLFEPSFGVVDLTSNVVHALGSWKNKVTVTTPDDIGKLTAEIVFTQPRIMNEIVYIAGDTITYHHLADIVEKITLNEMNREEWTISRLISDLAEDPNNPIKKYRIVFSQGNGVSWDQSKTFNEQHSIEMMNVEQWARANIPKITI